MDSSETSSSPSWGRRARQHRQADFRRDPNRGTRPQTTGVSDQPPKINGQFRGHQRAQTVAINGLFRDRLRAASHGRGQPISNPRRESSDLRSRVCPAIARIRAIRDPIVRAIMATVADTASTSGRVAAAEGCAGKGVGGVGPRQSGVRVFCLESDERLGGRFVSRQPDWFTVGRLRAQSWATFAKEAGIGATSRVQLVVESRALRGRTLNFKPVATFDAWEFETVWIPGADSKRYPVGDDGTINVLADRPDDRQGPALSFPNRSTWHAPRDTSRTDTTVATELTDNDPRPLNDCILLARTATPHPSHEQNRSMTRRMPPVP